VAGLTDPVVNAAALALLGDEFTLHIGGDARLDATTDGLRVSNGEQTIDVDQVLVASGRRPNIDGLGLENLGVTLDARGMPAVDRGTLQVGGLRVFLAGDANGAAPLLHEAADDGYIAGVNAMRADATCFVRRTPLAIVFSEPGIAMVGQRFASLATTATTATVIGGVDFRRQGRARAGQRNHGVLRLYADARDGRLLGAEMCAPAAEHLAHLLALAVSRALTVHELLAMPFYHPVLEEGLRTALRDVARQLPGADTPDLAECGCGNHVASE
jgi:dihydrolipoamide dehydrogenase